MKMREMINEFHVDIQKMVSRRDIQEMDTKMAAFNVFIKDIPALLRATLHPDMLWTYENLTLHQTKVITDFYNPFVQANNDAFIAQIKVIEIEELKTMLPSWLEKENLPDPKIAPDVPVDAPIPIVSNRGHESAQRDAAGKFFDDHLSCTSYMDYSSNQGYIRTLNSVDPLKSGVSFSHLDLANFFG
jgi:hypothetical protein